MASGTDNRGGGRPLGSLRKGVRELSRGAANALALMKHGRISAPYRAPHEIVHDGGTYRLRHYAPAHRRIAQPIVLVPPLMLTAEVWDISPELSAVTFLNHHGVDAWVVDFGAPEHEEGGLQRTLDDHVLAVADAVERVAALTGHDVHLAGYSQGGMFAYQAAAWLRSAHVASIVTFGSPVDIRRALPVRVHDDLADRILRAAKSATDASLADIAGLPGSLTSSLFRLLSARKEIRQFGELLGSLNDRDALARREPRRRFLGGEGFVAWPGPALRQFLEDVVANNRMTTGGLVIQGRPVSLSDISCPILYLVGARDDLVRPASVRGIRKAAMNAESFEWIVPAGHFGLVVGSTAMGTIWPGVVEWLEWQGAIGARPPYLAGDVDASGRRGSSRRRAADDASAESTLYDGAAELLDTLWRRLGDVSAEVGEVFDTLRWQVPRLARLKALRDDHPMSISRAFAEQAAAIPDAPFFVWRDRAYTWREADERVNRILRALVEQGVHPGMHVGVLMNNRPEYLTVVAALNRLNAVAVLLNAGARGASLRQALDVGTVTLLVTDAEHAAVGWEERDRRPVVAIGARRRGVTLPTGVVDLDPVMDRMPGTRPVDLPLDTARAGDTALLLFTSGTTGLPKAARITNRRWAMASLATAAACTLTTRDTVYCALPLHHATGMVVAVGGAVVGGARLVLAERFSVTTFWEEVRRTGSTVVFYVGEMCRYLVNAPESPGDAHHPVRLFVGNGMRGDVWERLVGRFGRPRVLEFYASTEGNVCLANLEGEKVGSVGRPLPGTPALALLEFDISGDELVRDADGRARVVHDGETGLLVARIEDSHPLGRFDGYVDSRETERKVLRDLMEPGDAWFNTGDLLRRDADGDYWFVDRVGDTFRYRGENVSTEQVAAVLHRVPGITQALVYGIRIPGVEGRVGMAAVELRPRARFPARALWQRVRADLFVAARPRFIRVVPALESTASWKPLRHRLAEEGADPSTVTDPVWGWDDASERYVRLDAAGWERMVRHEREHPGARGA